MITELCRNKRGGKDYGLFAGNHIDFFARANLPLRERS